MSLGERMKFAIYNTKWIIMENMLLFIGTQEIIIIALLVLLLFGGKKIPELMKGLGKGVKSFKDGVNGLEDEINKDDSNGNK